MDGEQQREEEGLLESSVAGWRRSVFQKILGRSNDLELKSSILEPEKFQGEPYTGIERAYLHKLPRTHKYLLSVALTPQNPTLAAQPQWDFLYSEQGSLEVIQGQYPRETGQPLQLSPLFLAFEHTPKALANPDSRPVVNITEQELVKDIHRLGDRIVDLLEEGKITGHAFCSRGR